MNELKPCQCKSEVIHGPVNMSTGRAKWRIVCLNCGLQVIRRTKHECVDAWNNRPIEKGLSDEIIALKAEIARLEGEIQGMLEGIEL